MRVDTSHALLAWPCLEAPTRKAPKISGDVAHPAPRAWPHQRLQGLLADASRRRTCAEQRCQRLIHISEEDLSIRKVAGRNRASRQASQSVVDEKLSTHQPLNGLHAFVVLCQRSLISTIQGTVKQTQVPL